MIDLVPTPRLHRLLRTLHRRGTLLRVAECGGIGLLIGTGAAIAVTLFLWLEGRPSVAASVGMMSLGTASGLMWGTWRRPSAVAAAVRADRQLKADDLFATAASLAASNVIDPWAATILAIAERRSRELSASAVVLRRFGGRTWGGIGLSTAVAITLALLTTSPDTTQADATSAHRARHSSLPQPRPLIALAPDSPLLPPAGGRSPGEGSDPAVDPRMNTAVADSRPATTPSAAGVESTGAATSSDGTGAGVGRTVPKPATRDPNPAVAVATESVRPPATQGTRPAAGTGSITADTPPAADGTAGKAGASAGSTSAPPWQSESWSADVGNAREQIQSGRVLAGYRDLVRQYFDLK